MQELPCLRPPDVCLARDFPLELICRYLAGVAESEAAKILHIQRLFLLIMSKPTFV